MSQQRVGAVTSVGAVRTLNEDALYAGRYVFVVADGMGGHAAGEVASGIVIDVLGGLDHPGVDAVAVRAAVSTANARVLEHAAGHPDAEGMGSTVVGFVLSEVSGDPEWLAFNVGDSRAYVYGSGGLRQVTVDHSEVQEMVDSGILTPEEARSAPNRNVITRAVGQLPAPEADVHRVRAGQGDYLVLASDGLTTEVEDELIVDVLRQAASPGEAAQRLVDLAVERGGNDNVTVIVVPDRVTGREIEPGEEDGEPGCQITRATTVPRDLIAREVIE